MDFGFDPFTLVVTIISVLVGLTLHEMMHAYAGLKLGDTTAQEKGRISLNPLDHIDPFMTIILPIITLILFHFPVLAAKPVPFSPDRVKWDEFGAAIIALAGPLTNLGLAVLGGILARLVTHNVPTFDLDGQNHLFDALTIFVVINVSLFIFNMIPIPPLDGSRVLYAFAPDIVREFMAQIEQFGIIIVFGLILAVPAFSQVISNLTQGISLFLL